MDANWLGQGITAGETRERSETILMSEEMKYLHLGAVQILKFAISLSFHAPAGGLLRRDLASVI
jgi:hypothetical protein